MIGVVNPVRSRRDELAELTERLIDEHEAVLPPGAVIRCVARSVQQLRVEGVPSGQLAWCAEPLARFALNERVTAGW